VFPNKTHPNMVAWAAGVPFGPRISPGLRMSWYTSTPRRTSIGLDTLNSGSESLREDRCGQFPLGRVVIGKHFVNEGRTIA